MSLKSVSKLCNIQSLKILKPKLTMMILNYLMAISLIILSVVKTTDLFIQSNKKLEKIELLFINQTRDLLKSSKNEKGNISLIAALFTTLLSFLLYFYMIKMKIEFQEAKYRSDSYLCFKYLNQETKKYINEMAFYNWSLRAAFSAQASGIATAEAIQIFKSLTSIRNTRHFYYLKKLSKNKYCQLPETFSYLKNAPFKTQFNMALITNIDETTIIRQKKWSNIYYKKPLGIRLKKSFCLKSEFQIENIFTPNISNSLKEIPVAGLSNLKCLAGLSS